MKVCSVCIMEYLYFVWMQVVEAPVGVLYISIENFDELSLNSQPQLQWKAEMVIIQISPVTHPHITIPPGPPIQVSFILLKHFKAKLRLTDCTYSLQLLTKLITCNYLLCLLNAHCTLHILNVDTEQTVPIICTYGHYFRVAHTDFT